MIRTPFLRRKDASVVPLLTPENVETVWIQSFIQVRELLFRGAGALFLRAVFHEVGEDADGRCAKGVADQFNLLMRALFAPVLQDAGIGAAVPLISVFLAVDLAVVDGAADNAVIGLDRAVPRTGDRADGR